MTNKIEYLKRVESVCDAMQKEIKEIDSKFNYDLNKAVLSLQGPRGLSHNFIRHIRRY